MLRSEVCFKRISINMFLTSFQEKIKKIYLEYFRFLGNALEDLSRIFQISRKCSRRFISKIFLRNDLEDLSRRYFQEMIQKIYLEDISRKCSRRFISNISRKCSKRFFSKIFLGNALEDLSRSIFPYKNTTEFFARRMLQQIK